MPRKLYSTEQSAPVRQGSFPHRITEGGPLYIGIQRGEVPWGPVGRTE